MRPDYPIPRIKGKALSASTSAGRMHRSEQANSVTNLVAKLFSAVPLISGMAKLTTSPAQSISYRNSRQAGNSGPRDEDLILVPDAGIATITCRKSAFSQS
jgi:hypothetical protein